MKPERLRDLHAHITGSIDADALFELIFDEKLYRSDKDKIDTITKPFGIRLASEITRNVETARMRFNSLYPCRPNGKTEFDSIMKRFILTSYLLEKVPDSEEKIGYIVASRFKQQNVNYVEWRINPLSATLHQTAEEGLEKLYHFYDGMRKVANLDSKLVLSIAKNQYGKNWRPLPEKIKYLKLELEKLLKAGTGLPIVGLDAVNKDEITIADLQGPLSLAENYGLALVPHVGELCSKNLETDLENVETAVGFGAKRLGHAVSAYIPLKRLLGTYDNTGKEYTAQRIQKLKLKQDTILNLLKENGIAIEVCPTSNMAAHLGGIDYSLHPADILHKRGIPIVACTDDYGIFGSPLSSEIDILTKYKHLDRAMLIKNSKTYSINQFKR